jgi:putative Holliday junction resolvase
MGLPLNMDGTPGTHHDEVLSYAKALSDRLGLDVLLVDERRSTMQAEHHLKILGTGGWRKRKARVDEVAAAVILQSWLDGGGRTGAREEE